MAYILQDYVLSWIEEDHIIAVFIRHVEIWVLFLILLINVSDSEYNFQYHCVQFSWFCTFISDHLLSCYFWCYGYEVPELHSIIILPKTGAEEERKTCPSHPETPDHFSVNALAPE